MTTIGFVGDLHAETDVADELFERLRETLAAVEAADPDRLVVLGDLIQESTRATDREVLDRLVDLFESADAPVRFVPGNHDVETLLPETLEAAFGHELWTVAADAGVQFLDTSAPRLTGGRGELSARQIDALRAALPDAERTVVVAHHPLAARSLAGNRWFEGYPEEAFCGDKRAVEALLAPPNVAAVVNGHLHRRDVTVVDGVPHVTVDSFNKRLDDDAETGAYALLRLTADRLTVEHVAGDGTEHVVRYPLPA